jgi:hypothetical protein
MPTYTINGKKVRTDRELTEAEINEIEEYIEAAKKANWTVDRTFRKLTNLGYTYAGNNSVDAFQNYLEDRLLGITNIKVTSQFNINKEIETELAALENASIVENNFDAIIQQLNIKTDCK